jgi:hypothetical protein
LGFGVQVLRYALEYQAGTGAEDSASSLLLSSLELSDTKGAKGIGEELYVVVDCTEIELTPVYRQPPKVNYLSLFEHGEFPLKAQF